MPSARILGALDAGAMMAIAFNDQQRRPDGRSFIFRDKRDREGPPASAFCAYRDGHIRAHSAENGAPLWDLNTMRDFDTVDGVKSQGARSTAPEP